MSKGLIAFIAMVFIAVVAAMIIYMKKTADEARNKSDEILEEFKRIDKDLQDKDQQFDSLNKMYFDSLYKADK